MENVSFRTRRAKALGLIMTRAIELWRDENGNELAEYALVLTCFALAGIAAMHVLETNANARVETDETNYTNALVNGY
jgi:Flp pilus assembly pilin Flp